MNELRNERNELAFSFDNFGESSIQLTPFWASRFLLPTTPFPHHFRRMSILRHLADVSKPPRRMLWLVFQKSSVSLHSFCAFIRHFPSLLLKKFFVASAYPIFLIYPPSFLTIDLRTSPRILQLFFTGASLQIWRSFWTLRRL